MLFLLLIFPHPAASYVEFNCPGISDCLTRTFFEDFSHYQSLYMRDDINLSRHFLHKHINGCVYPTYFGMDYEEDVDFRTIEIPRWVKKFLNLSIRVYFSNYRNFFKVTVPQIKAFRYFSFSVTVWLRFTRCR